MGGSRKLLAIAVAAAFSAPAFAQTSTERALNNNPEAIRGYNQVQAGLERSQRAPLEAVWLRAEVLEEMWQRNPTLSQAFQGCEKAGTPKQGCAVSGRAFWRFTLAPSHNAFAPGLSAQAYRASPPDKETAPPAGGVYLVASAKSIGQHNGSILLAAGATAQLIDTAFPSILVEVKAPDDQPLLLGSLASSDIGKALALLTRLPDSAKVATLADGGRVTLQRTQVASIAPVPAVAAARPPRPDFTGDFTTLAAAMERPTALAKRDARLQEFDTTSLAALDMKRRPDLRGDFTALLAAVEMPTALAKRESRALDFDTKAIASLDIAPKPSFSRDFSGVVAALEIATALAKREARVQEFDPKALASLDVAPKPSFGSDFSAVVAAMEKAVALPKRDARMQDFDAKSLASLDVAPKAQLSGDLSTMVAAVEVPVSLPKRDTRVQEVDSTAIAALDLAPKAVSIPARPINVVVDVAPAPSSNAAIARMRAEIEAEVARENARLAQTLQGRTSKRLAFGT